MTGAEVVAIAAIASAALAATSTAIQASNQAKMERHNARVAQQNATAALRQADADAKRQDQLVKKQLAKRRTAFAAGGISLEGSPLDLLEDVAAEGQLDVLGIRQRGMAEARRFSITASQSRARADAAVKLGAINTAQQVSGSVARIGASFGAGG